MKTKLVIFSMFLVFGTMVNAAITFDDSITNVYLEGRHAGCLRDVLKNYPARATELRTAVNNRAFFQELATRNWRDAEKTRDYAVSCGVSLDSRINQDIQDVKDAEPNR